MSGSESSWVVCKFGGTSVSTRARWETIAALTEQHIEQGARPMLVCSALSGISDRLDAILHTSTPAERTEHLSAIRKQHLELARDLGVDTTALDEALTRVEGLVHELPDRTPSPRQQAALMAQGELLSTRLGAAFLNARGISTRWVDAREVLRSERKAHLNPARRYLSATCGFYPDPILQDHLHDAESTAVLTQGFIAGNEIGETVLLGRGGSDTSAAYFAAKLEAERLEIWTDVPGLFTANPRDIPSARLLKQLTYNEAQELATMGASVLHPRCIDPVRTHQIPLHVCCTDAPDMQGTVIRDDVPDYGPQVKAISAKSNVTAISMETLGMWQQVGFLADVFSVFKHNGVSIDMVATSEANVTVTLDPVANALEPDTIDQVLRDLNAFCNARVIGPCAVVSLVGRHIRALLSDLGPALEVFDEQNIYLVSQAASDLNFSFVVDAEQAPRLVRELHAERFSARPADELFGPSWAELFDTNEPDAQATPLWWQSERDALLHIADTTETPGYVYHAPTLRTRAQQLMKLDAVDQPYYAVKANPHPDVLRCLYREGLGFECVSPGEVERVFEAVPDVDPQRVLFQPNFAALSEYRHAFERGVRVTLDNVQPLEAHPEVFADTTLFLRIDPGRGHGHHRHVRTAGAQSKFGIVPDELPHARALANEHNVRIQGLHVHVGSGITRAEPWAEIAAFLGSLAADFPDVEVINVGGGLGVPERPNGDRLPLDALDERLLAFKQSHPQYALWMEPGRFLAAEAGALVARVTQTKQKGDVTYVGLDAGMHTLMRPALYGAYHEIVNLTKLDRPKAETVNVVGPICESGDVLGYSRRLPPTEPGDVVLIATTGAYGAAMSNTYNLRSRPNEHLIDPA
ncbi:MAG: bifunctional aspartate kinase/diaminopimelate decarboxylase [Longimonas sp.]|uniref:bifunctional aspartate kinase/diaminopimelate decarboxylase n=1 Tax=Longimonas sp. TaxID=2039626 RepID=UPI00336313AA